MPLPILPAGDAAVAGFSGTAIVGSPPGEPQRVEKTYINLDGPALRVIGLSRMGGPPQAQLVAAPKTFTVTARQTGQVFSLALDAADPPNIYAAATSAYGLPIVVPDADGDGVPDRSRRGAPNAAFMPGLFGPVVADGGPGSIWKIDGRTGAVALFANVLLNGVPNSGPALGGLAFDRASRQLFVADRDTGMIHRFTLDGVDRGYFDHGAQALAAAGLPPIAFDARKRLNIESPTFDSGNPATWAYAPQARRVFGVAVNRGRIYYAVAAGLRIWSVSILPDGSFGSDARVEVTVPRSASASAEISEILFDDNGDMLVAERGEPTGAYDYKALAAAGENRVLRFRPKRPDDPPVENSGFPFRANMRSAFRRATAMTTAALRSATVTTPPETSTARCAAARCGAPASSCATRAIPRSSSVCSLAVRSSSTGCRATPRRCCGRRTSPLRNLFHRLRRPLR